jgi:hypothetical protein
MRDYNNIPNLKWENPSSQYQAKAQILHQEPVILNMPQVFDYDITGSEEHHCQYNPESGIFYNCNGGATLDLLADRNHQPALHELAAACVTTSSQVDIDAQGQRIIIHD